MSNSSIDSANINSMFWVMTAARGMVVFRAGGMLCTIFVLR